jgi:hypothetical protein
VFAFATLVALVLLLLEGKNQWFFNDDWGQWATNRFGPGIDRPGDFFFSPHSGHWMTLNRVVFEAIYRTTGLRWYLVYLLPVIFFHLAAAWLLRHISLRAGVRPWMATSSALVFLFLGTGAEVLTWSDAFGFMAGLVFGGGQLVLADHDGPLDRRDVIGLLLGLLSMTSGAAAITMLGVVGLAGLLRARFRAVAFHIAPPALAWLIWYAAIGHTDKQKIVNRASLGGAPSYFYRGVTTSVEAVTQIGLAVLLTVLLIGYVVWRSSSWREQRLAPIAALAAGLPTFWLLVTITRLAEGVDPAASSRYLYVTAFFTLPMLTVAVDDLARDYRLIAKVATGVFAWAMLVNAISLDSFARFSGGRAYHVKRGVATVLALPGTSELPPETRLEDPDGIVKGGWVAPVGVLLLLNEHGDFGDLPAPTEHERLRWGTPLLVHLTATDKAPPCSTLTSRQELKFDRSGSVVVLSERPIAVDVTLRSTIDNTVGPVRHFDVGAGSPSRLAIGLDQVSAEIVLSAPASLCRLPD